MDEINFIIRDDGTRKAFLSEDSFDILEILKASRSSKMSLRNTSIITIIRGSRAS